MSTHSDARARPVLVLDSGSGGLTVWQEIHQLMPSLNTIYLADFAGFPYGLKSATDLENRVLALLATIVPLYQPMMIVVACNTASTLLLESLRQHFSIPVVGVVPAIKTAAALTRTGRIGLLATDGTVQRQYTDQLISEFAPHCEVTRVGSNLLVQMGEDVLRGRSVDLEQLKQAIAPVLQARCDQVVLGCTHFPLLRSLLEEVAPDIGWVDSGAAIARRVESLLQAQCPEVEQTGDSRHGLLYTGEAADSVWLAAMGRMGFSSSQALESLTGA